MNEKRLLIVWGANVPILKIRICPLHFRLFVEKIERMSGKIEVSSNCLGKTCAVGSHTEQAFTDVIFFLDILLH